MVHSRVCSLNVLLSKSLAMVCADSETPD
jgi:hypothetical protein